MYPDRYFSKSVQKICYMHFKFPIHYFILYLLNMLHSNLIEIKFVNGQHRLHTLKMAALLKVGYICQFLSDFDEIS